MTSYGAEIRTEPHGVWTGNRLRFATEQEAKHYAKELARAWALVHQTRVCETADEVNAGFEGGKLHFVGED